MAKKLLIVSQVFVPDPAAVGQYLAEAAEEMIKRGWEVEVLTADRSYEDYTVCFPKREQMGKVSVRRLPFSSSGKSSILRRLMGQLMFCAQAIFYAIVQSKLDAVLVTTSPPMGGVVGWAVGVVRQVSVKYWVMDINPDQAVVIKAVGERSPMTRLLEWGNRRILSRASDIISLDRHMELTMRSKLPDSTARFHILPPWPMEGRLERIEHDVNPFRREHDLIGKFVFMYSGNHSVVHPLTTILKVAIELHDREDIAFLFIGGGLGKHEVDAAIAEHELTNVHSLPYQPLERIKFSLSGADVHLVSMGDDMVGIVHPCKFYGAMSLAKPILLLGPQTCHISDVIDAYDCGWRVGHGEVSTARELVEEIVALADAELLEKGRAGRHAIDSALGKSLLTKQFADIIEK